MMELLLPGERDKPYKTYYLEYFHICLMKKNFLLFYSLFILILVGCSTENAPDKSGSSVVSSAPAALTLEGFFDMAGEPLLFEESSINAIILDYAVGWNFDQKGYVKIRAGSEVGNCKVIAATSRYWIQYLPDGNMTLVCDQSDISLDCLEPLTGILAITSEEIRFHPYSSPNGNFWSLCPRSKKSEELNRNAAILPVEDGIPVQFLSFPLFLDNQHLTWRDLNLNDPGTEVFYYTATIEPSSLNFYAFTQGEGTQVFEDRATCYITSADKIILGRPLFPEA